MPPLKEIEPEELVGILRPCWWPSDAPRKIEIPKLEPDSNLMIPPEILADAMATD